jgi:anthranilate synthase component 1
VTGTCPSPDLSYQEYYQICKILKSLPGFVPITITFPMPDVSPATLYRHLRTSRGFLLESMEGVPRRAVRSIIGTGIREIFTLHDDGEPGNGPVDQIRNFIKNHQLHGKAPAGFAGGLVGYCSYDMVSSLNPGYLIAGKEENCPIGRFMVTNSGIVLDHHAGTCTIFVTPAILPGDDLLDIYTQAASEASDLATRVRQVPYDEQEMNITRSNPPDISVSSPMDKEKFEAAVRETLEHIRAGDIFQAVISRRFEAPFSGDPFSIYSEVRTLNPSPYLYFLEFGDETIIGSSPEMLVKVEGDDVYTVPIAGTRPRGRNQEEDDRLAAEMLADEKEKAEHLMLVDLARNDIGKVAAFGSVQVTSFMEVDKFSHVQHMTSVVTGKLHDESDRFDALGSCFPAGTVSGAPKLRAMQIIAELEPHPRGIYAGAVGYIGFDDLFEFAIAIRTTIVRDGVASFQTGAGIVADSDPTREYEETGQKARAMLSALSRASVYTGKPDPKILPPGGIV